MTLFWKTHIFLWRCSRYKNHRLSKLHEGHTLVELLIAMLVAMIVMGAVYSIYHVQLREHGNQSLILKARQNIRSALIITEQQIRMAGFDPDDSGLFGITDVRRFDLIGTHADDQGQPALTFTRDINENGNFDGGGEQVRFCIRQEADSGKKYLAWNMGSGRFPLAETIEALGFAYAVDQDKDGLPDKCTAGEHFIWAVDSDNDNRLDINLDTNCDGDIDQQDDQNNDSRINSADGSSLNPPIGLDCIKAVRFWMLTVTDRRIEKHDVTQTFVVGDQVYKPSDDGRFREVLEMTVLCRNL